jgi:hypothetical protein
MKAYECYADVSADGKLSIPPEIVSKLRLSSKIRVMILVDEEESEWNDFAMNQFFKGYAEEDAIYDDL